MNQKYPSDESRDDRVSGSGEIVLHGATLTVDESVSLNELMNRIRKLEEEVL
jgi:hypothetical protein